MNANQNREYATPQDRLRHHVTGAIERGEKQAIEGMPAQATHTPFQWGEDEFATVAETEHAIAAAVVENLANTDYGSVVHGETIHNIEIVAYLLDEDGRRMNDAAAQEMKTRLHFAAMDLEVLADCIDNGRSVCTRTMRAQAKEIRATIAKATGGAS